MIVYDRSIHNCSLFGDERMYVLNNNSESDEMITCLFTYENASV